MPQHRVARYMSRFQCIGPRCEASCCRSGWTITVDEDHYHKLARAMSRRTSDRDRFRAAIRRETEAKQSRHRFALIVLDEQDSCRLLDPDGGCSVHRRFGEDVLPDVCFTYPRKVSLAHEHIELAGALSCPEVTRELYRAADSTTMDRLDPSTLRNRATQRAAHDSADLYDQYLDDVRATIVALLETPGYPLASRLFFVGWFAEKTRATFHRDASAGATEALEDAILSTADDETLATWHEAFAALEVTTPLAARVIAGALKDRIEEAAAYEPFRDLVRACFANLGGQASGDTMTVESLPVYAAYVERRKGRDGAEIDRMLTSYAIDFWLKEYYTGSRDLSEHANKLVLRIALLRFLLFSHPGFDEADPARTLVEVTFKLARAVEHDEKFGENLNTLLARLQITSLAHAMFLMKV